jgi:O-antigen/teichoic acid export membrane protein
LDALIKKVRNLEGVRGQILRAMLGVGGIKFISLPITLLTSVLLARALGPIGYGNYVFVFTVVSLVALPIGPGLGQLITREVALYKQVDDRDSLNGIYRRSIQWLSLGTIVLMVLFGGWLALDPSAVSDERVKLFIVGLVLVPLIGLSSIKNSFLSGFKLVQLAQFTNLLVKPGTHFISICLLFLLGLLSPAMALASQSLSLFIAVFVSGYFISGQLFLRYRSKSYKYNKDWIKSIFPFTMLVAVATLNSQIGLLLLGWLGNAEEVAAMRVGMSGASLILFSLSIVNSVIAPYVASAKRTNDFKEMHKISRFSSRVAFIIAVPISIPLIFFGDNVVDIVYGKEYVDSSTFPLVVLSVAQLINVGFGSIGVLLTMSGFEKDTLWGQVIALCSTFILALFLIPRFGANGAACSVSIGLVLWNLILGFRLKKRLGFMPTFMG